MAFCRDASDLSICKCAIQYTNEEMKIDGNCVQCGHGKNLHTLLIMEGTLLNFRISWNGFFQIFDFYRFLLDFFLSFLNKGRKTFFPTGDFIYSSLY